MRLLDEIEIPLIPVLVDMETTGILVDRVLLGEMSRGFSKELTTLELDIYRAAGGEFNINSTPQLRTVLFERLKLPVQKRTKTGASTDVEVLEQLAAQGAEVPRLLIEYRELTKLKSTYVDALPGYIRPDTGRVHTSFNQTGAATGRLSSSDPNLQNIIIEYNTYGEIISRRSPGFENPIRYFYDGYGRLETIELFDGQHIRRKYFFQSVRTAFKCALDQMPDMSLGQSFR